jgi:ADP-ribose pyrophosphatase YjhB (NUDIX family)
MREANFCAACGARLEQRHVLGKMRPVCPNCGQIVFFDPKVAVVVLLQQDETLLLVKRGVDPGKGRWALPAGFVDAGEDPRSAAIREVQEETGLTVQIERLIDVFPKADDTGTADIIIAYAARVLDGTPHADDDADEVGWFSAENLPELVFATTEILVARWREGNF